MHGDVDVYGGGGGGGGGGGEVCKGWSMQSSCIYTIMC